jgi:predicted lipoprotein with Yx(FWY)xxD motif
VKFLSSLRGKRPFVPILALTLILAGCGGTTAATTVSASVAVTTSASAPATTASTSAVPATTSAAAASSAAATSSAAASAGGTTVLVKDDPKLGMFLTDLSGKTLYWYTKDKPGVSNCSGACLAAWPPYTHSGTPTLPAGVPGTLSAITRSDGISQIAYDDMPLYYYAKDVNPGDTTGQDVGKVWFVVPPTAGPLTPPAASSASGSAAATSSAAAAAASAGATTVLVKTDPKLGQLLTDPSGRTLYWYTKDAPGVSNCAGGCLAAWPAFTRSGTPTLPSGVPGTLSTITRSDGSTQLAYDGMPLYYYVKDANPGDTTGQDVGKVWFVVPPTAGPLTPPAS